MLPFDAEQFFDVFRRYNEATAVAQPIVFALGLAAAALLVARRYRSAVAITAALWAWSAVVYHLTFFAPINPAARVFGVVFLAEAALLLRWSMHMESPPAPARAESTVAAVLIVYALMIYPLIGHAAGQVYPAIPTFGVPCPTTIFTLGVLALFARAVPPIVLAIPVLWSIVATSAAMSLGVPEDFGLPIAAAAVIFLLPPLREKVARSAG